MYEHSIRLTSVAAAVVAALALVGCNRNVQDGTTASRDADSAMARAEQKVDSAAQKAEAAAKDMKQAAGEAGDKVAAAANDATITAQVNAELAKDSELSALKIDVDTAQGRVVLRGTAPDAASRERATRLAAGVKGVASVENFLSVQTPKS